MAPATTSPIKRRPIIGTLLCPYALSTLNVDFRLCARSECAEIEPDIRLSCKRAGRVTKSRFGERSLSGGGRAEGGWKRHRQQASPAFAAEGRLFYSPASAPHSRNNSHPANVLQTRDEGERGGPEGRDKRPSATRNRRRLPFFVFPLRPLPSALPPSSALYRSPDFAPSFDDRLASTKQPVTPDSRRKTLFDRPSTNLGFDMESLSLRTPGRRLRHFRHRGGRSFCLHPVRRRAGRGGVSRRRLSELRGVDFSRLHLSQVRLSPGKAEDRRAGR